MKPVAGKFDPKLDDLAEESVQVTPAVVTEGQTLMGVPLDTVPVNFPLPCPFYVAVGDRFVKLRSRGDTLTVQRIQNLSQSGATLLYLAKIHWRAFVDGLEAYRLPRETDGDERARHLRGLLHAQEAEDHKKGWRPRRAFFEKIQTLVERLADELYKSPASGVRHLRRNHEPALYSANHALNSAIYGTLIGISLKYPLEQGKSLAFACLVHDMGNLTIPKEVLQKKGPLTAEEFALMKTHTAEGAELLQGVGAATEVVKACYQHHERVDGKGYPLGLEGKDIHPFAKICAIADVYDAITSNRPHQEGLSAQEAMRRMRSQEGLFDMDFLAKLSFDKIR